MTTEMRTPIAKPMAVIWAVRLLRIGLVLGLLRAPFAVPSIQAGSKAMFVVILLGGAAVMLFLIAELARGQTFIRWLFLIGTLLTLPQMLSAYQLELQQSPGLFCLSALVQVTYLSALCLLFTAKANAWFKAIKVQAT
jgi:hypothetical protein